VEACVAKPGLIDAPGKFSFIGSIAKTVLLPIVGVPKVQVDEMAAALIKQIVSGFEKETLMNDDLARIGKALLAGK
jgi:hypothetical protein